MTLLERIDVLEEQAQHYWARATASDSDKDTVALYQGLWEDTIKDLDRAICLAAWEESWGPSD